MKLQIGGFLVLVLVLAGLAAGLETESQTLPWWPARSGDDNSINVKVDQNEETSEIQSHYDEQEVLSDDENEIGVDDLSVIDEDREAFYNLMNTMLWDAEDTGDNDANAGRQFQYRRRGLLQRTMPVMVRRNDNVMGQAYRGFVDGCYDILCALGLRGLASNIARMFT